MYTHVPTRNNEVWWVHMLLVAFLSMAIGIMGLDWLQISSARKTIILLYPVPLITSSRGVGPQNITVGCWEFSLNLSLPVQLF